MRKTCPTNYRNKFRCAVHINLCVQLANITVYYLLNKHVYSNPELMSQVASVKRYIDDGAGQFTGTVRQFSSWIKKVNDYIVPIGLEIDEYEIENTGNFVSFLDVKFTFDTQGELRQTFMSKRLMPGHIYTSAAAILTTSSQVLFTLSA